jgi:hypothetical protein
MENADKKEEKKKGFFSKLFEKLDQKLEERSKKTGCGCSAKKNNNGDSCCS